MKNCLIFFLLINFAWFINNTFLQEASQSLVTDLESINTNNDYYSNSLIPGADSVEKLKKIIESLIVKLDEMSSKKDTPHFKYCKANDIKFNTNNLVEIRMPEKGKELKIKHDLNVDDILNVNVIIVNGNKKNLIMRSQVDLISQKALYNWYIDKENFVLIRPNNNIIQRMEEIKFFFAGNLANNKPIIEIVFDKSRPDALVNKTLADCKEVFNRLCKLEDKTYDVWNKVGNGDTSYICVMKKGSEKIGTISTFYLLELANTCNERAVFMLIDEIHEGRIVNINDQESAIKERIIHIVEEKSKSNVFSSLASDLNSIKLDISNALHSQMSNIDKMDDLKVHSEKIKENSKNYRNNAKQAKCTTFWQNFKLWIILVSLLVMIVLLVVLPLVLIKKSESTQNTATPVANL